jgi:hypothetical protein
MKKNILKEFFSILIFIPFFFQSKAQELLPILKVKFGIDNVTFKDSSAFKEYYAIKFRQPIDHSDTTKGFFMQRVLLGHNDSSKPMVIETSGYELLPYQTILYKAEPVKILDANQLIVEDRYYGQSIPDNINKTWLNFEQITADYHAIKLAFSDIYRSQWMTTGGSKGGLSALNYSFYYPNDMAASFVYVAPVLKGPEDGRVTGFLKEKRSTETGQKLLEIQKHLLQRKSILLPAFLEILKLSDLDIGTMDPETLYDFAVLEFDFNYWQYISDFDKLTKRNKRVLEQLNERGFKSNALLVSPYDSMLATFPMCTWYFLDKPLSGPFFYHSYTQMGCYGYEEKLFKGYLKHKTYSQEFLAGEHPKYSWSYVKAFNKFLKNRLTHTILIYGAEDPWTSCMASISATSDNLLFVNPKTNHATEINDLDEKDKQQIRKKLESWIGKTPFIIK